MSLWDNMKKAAAKAGSAAMVAGQKTRLHGEILLVDRDVKGRKQQFGIDLYNHVGPMASSPDFFAANDPLTETLRPPLLKVQREIAALAIRRTKVKEDIAQAEVKRAAAFPDKAITFADKAKNAAKSAALAGNEAKLSTDLSVVENQIRHFKQTFGEDIYEVFVDLEDNKGWLPTDRTIRAMYDQARQDVEKLIKKRAAKIAELENIGGSYQFDKKKEEGALDGTQSASGNQNTGYDAPVAVPAAPAAPTPPAAPVSTDPKVQGMFLTPDTVPAAQTDVFAAPAPAAGAPIMPSTNYQAPISQTGSYMQQSNMSQAPAASRGYSDAAPMGGYSDSTPMGGFSSPMGGSMDGFSNQPAPMGGNAMGGYSDQAPMGSGFADFSGLSGGGGFPQDPPQQQPSNGMTSFQLQQQQHFNMSAFPQQQQQQQSNDPFGGSSSNQQKSSGQSNDLLQF